MVLEMLHERDFLLEGFSHFLPFHCRQSLLDRYRRRLSTPETKKETRPLLHVSPAKDDSENEPKSAPAKRSLKAFDPDEVVAHPLSVCPL